jgi:hypothetical protein
MDENQSHGTTGRGEVKSRVVINAVALFFAGFLNVDGVAKSPRFGLRRVVA